MFSQAVLRNIPTRNVSSYLKLKTGFFNDTATIPGYIAYKIKDEREILHTEQGNSLIQSG
jgi:hypothetical protein